MTYLAHIRQNEDGTEQIQSVEEHCRQTALHAERALESANLGQAGYLAGLMHDAGKCKQEFQRYLLEQEGKRGSVNHTFAGCRMILEHFHTGDGDRDLTAELLAYAVGAHHGLFDCVDERGSFGFAHRMEALPIHYEESKAGFLSSCADWDELEARFQKACEECSRVNEKISDLADRDGEDADGQYYFYVGLLARLLVSAVIEGDRRDTAAFMIGQEEPPPPEDRRLFWKRYLDRMEDKLREFSKDTPINWARGEISDQCRAFAEKPGGVYRLNVPTGGGKTLSALRYALAHAAKWGKQRVIFVTPLLAILEQNAKVIRTYMQDDAIILEHHSNVIQTNTEGDALDLRELAVDSWHAPVILTTLVQLLNTMFLGKTTSVRRFQALCEAVIVIDEVQTVPNHMLSLFNLAVNFLSAVCGTTFLLCSATQPLYEKTAYPLLLSRPEDVVPFDRALWKPFQRTRMTDAGGMRLEEIPDFIRSVLAETDSLLVICNKRAESAALFQAMKDAPDCRCFHLSASMCMAHRRDVLERVKASLAQSRTDGSKTLCISTQVMEAGVDISFHRVIRLAAGMDSVVQAAGRCNRNGEDQEKSPVYLLDCSDENLGRLREMKMQKQAAMALLNEFRRHPERFQNDLSSDEAIAWYYQKLFGEEARHEGYQEYPTGRSTIFSMLSCNEELRDDDNPDCETYLLTQAFKEAGKLFQVFDEESEDVVVCYGEGEKLLEELESYPDSVRPAMLKDWNTRAKPYIISLYQYQKEKLAFGLRERGGVLALAPEDYDEDIGLTMNREDPFLEV